MGRARLVLDVSHLWTAARRYINHSCAPNCVAEVVTFERGHKIIISSSRRIQKGEEVSPAPPRPRPRLRGAHPSRPWRRADGAQVTALVAGWPWGGPGVAPVLVRTPDQSPLPGSLQAGFWSLAPPLVVPSLRVSPVRMAISPRHRVDIPRLGHRRDEHVLGLPGGAGSVGASPLYGGEEPEGLHSVGASSPALRGRLYFGVILLERTFLNRVDARLVLHISLTGHGRTHLRPRAWCPRTGSVAWGQRRPPHLVLHPSLLELSGGPLDGAQASASLFLYGSRPESLGKSCGRWECREEGGAPQDRRAPLGAGGLLPVRCRPACPSSAQGPGGGRPAGAQPL